MMRLPVAFLAAAFCLFLGASSARADILMFKDGRWIEGKRIQKTDKGYRIQFENGTIDVADDLVVDYFQTDDAGAWVPRTDVEKAQAEKGLAPWRGKWIKASRRQRLAKKELEERRERMQQWKDRRKWVNRGKAKSKHYKFEHTLPDPVFNELKALFDNYYNAVAKDWKIRPSKEYGKATVNIYHNPEYYYQVSGSPSRAVGYYMPSRRDLNFYYDRDNHRYTLDVMFHEAHHMMTHMMNPKVSYPAWIREGMAEYYGASVWNARTKKLEVGGIQAGRLCVLWDRIKKDKWQGLEDLITGNKVDALYAWGWSFCHFMMSTPKYTKKFRKFYAALARSKHIQRKVHAAGRMTIPPTEQIKHFRKIVGVKDLGALEAEWHDYIKSALALDRVELDWSMGAHILYIYGEREKAREFYEKAIAEPEAKGMTFYRYSKLLFEEGKIEEASDNADKATQRDPLLARAWFLLGRCHEAKGKAEDGLRIIRLAGEIDPDDENIWLHLAEIEEQEEGE